MGRSTNANKDNTNAAMQQAQTQSDRGWAMAQGAGSAANDIIYGKMQPQIDSIFAQNPWMDPTYQSNLRSKVATAASGTEKNFEEKANENLKRTGGLNTGATLADMDEARREKTRTMNSELKDQQVADFDKYQKLKQFGIGAYGEEANMFNSRFAPSLGMTNNATSTMGELGKPVMEQNFWDQLALAGIQAGGAVGAGFAGA